MTLYFIIKYLRVLGAIVILGTGSGIAFFMLMAHRSDRSDRRHPALRSATWRAALLTPDLWIEPLGALVKTGPRSC